MSEGWIGVDLDGTLAEYHGWGGMEDIGQPIEPMLRRVYQWLDEERTVKIFTARVAGDDREEVEGYIRSWLEDAGLPRDMEITNVKDMHMVELWDDRCVQVEFNTGRRVDGAPG